MRFPATALLLSLLASCAGRWVDPLAERHAGAPAWPPPPESPRVEHVASIHRHQDLFDEAGFWRSIGAVVAGPPDSVLVRPYCVALHPSGLLVGDPGARRVHFFDWSRRRYVAIGGDIEGGLPSPVAVAVLPDGTVIVSDSRRGAIERFDARGRHLGAFCAEGPPARPAGLAVHGDTVAVVDVLGHCIRVFDIDGRPLRSFGRQGSGEGEFNFPTHLAGDGAGGYIVADSMNFRIQRIDADGEFLSAFGKPGSAVGDFAQPKGVVAIDSNTFAAVEGRYDTVIFFDGGGNLLLPLGGAGSDPGEFWLPAGLACDPARGLLFVADSYNARVQVFRLLSTAPGEGGEADP